MLLLVLGSRSASDLQNFIFIYLVDLYAMFCLCVVHSGYFNNNSYKRVCTCWYYRRYRVFLHTYYGLQEPRWGSTWGGNGTLISEYHII